MQKVFAVVLLLLATYSFAEEDILVFKHGVKFDHKGHQSEKVGNCTVCHDEKVGKITGFSKEWAHRRCIICHDLITEGRNTNCGACHLTMGSLNLTKAR